MRDALHEPAPRALAYGWCAVGGDRPAFRPECGRLLHMNGRPPLMLDDRRVRLRAFLADGARLPFVWGERDCALWACDWIAAVRGVDPAEALRSTYGTGLACARLLRSAGGLPALASDLAARAGIIETDTAEAGDVGAIETRDGAYLAVCTGDAWAIKAADGLAIAPACPLKVWAI